MRVSTGRSNISTLAAVLAFDWTIQVSLKIVLQKKCTVENENVWYSQWGPVVRKMVHLHVAKIFSIEVLQQYSIGEWYRSITIL
jgi:hypothetical protein